MQLEQILGWVGTALVVTAYVPQISFAGQEVRVGYKHFNLGNLAYW
jgi:hypothetical protein